MRSFLSRQNSSLLLALALAFVYHGGLLLTGTFKRTYDAYIHIFFADHYARAWFDHWEYRWYTGFTMTSYPPGSQQSIALISPVVGLLNGFIIVQLFAVLLVVLGVYRFSRIWVTEEAAGFAALLAVFSSSITETVHVFGQLPTMFSLGFLLNALPFVRYWLDTGKRRYLLMGWVVLAGCTAGHHVTTLFGAVFFVGPVLLAGIVDKFRQPLPDEPTAHPSQVAGRKIFPLVIRRLRRIVPVTFRAGIFGIGLVVVLLGVVLPYWLWSKDDPIVQISIPHASRDSFIQNTNAGLVFWLIPYGLTLLALPYIFYKGLNTRAWPLTLSLMMAVLLGTGGTTPLPKALLGGAYYILTLDRFTFWATILLLPLLGEFVVSITKRGLANYLRNQFGVLTWKIVLFVLVVFYLALSGITANFTQFRKFQPAAIDMQPIVTFLEKDQHSRWRYLPLGFGDQMAWLSAQTSATTVDGNYHSARRLPELTTTSIERLEGAKFRGIPGLTSLQQFLAVPEKYNLKFVLSNDQYYDPLLYFSGWHRLQRLENGIMVWEREDIPPLPEVLPRKEIPIYQRIMWGTIPMAAIFSAIFTLSLRLWGHRLLWLFEFIGLVKLTTKIRIPGMGLFPRFWRAIDRKLLRWSTVKETESDNGARWQFWSDWMMVVKNLKPAPPSKQVIRSLVLLIIIIVGLGGTVFTALRPAGPLQVVESYYDALDFRRFSEAYSYLDPTVRPSYDQYLLELSVTNGLVASYGKLDSVRTSLLSSEPERVVAQAKTVWLTSLDQYPTVQQHVLVKRSGKWYIVPDQVDLTIPPDQFFNKAQVNWYSQGRRRVTTQTTSFSDVLDRPVLQIMSARFVQGRTGYAVVGELMNTDVNPADVTLTAVLFDKDNKEVTEYNAQEGIVHKLLPKEITPFRVDFAGVSGQTLGISNPEDPPNIVPSATPNLKDQVTAFEVYAKAVVTGRDLLRDVGVQDMKIEYGADGLAQLTGQLINYGTQEATIPHIFLTYYDSDGRVAWVDDQYVESAVRPQRTQPFSIVLSRPTETSVVLDKGNTYSNILSSQFNLSPQQSDRIPLPKDFGYSSVRVNVHYYAAGATE
ncbi:MAG: hypothetical protein HXX08_20715 [Chloroflexi bacterium]|uniref:Uncharacterized protein n=1 Tax=Candidatus Chlorohelix allophototropha TaxID=3003348 RepID=A0A8T7M816_9CHLR|nr:hypothetical protein [Chloroflexota bacterium]WJW68220.1 hypothetical protein OZ401_003826 [Chloroflexota bacterium L227-S17]